MAMKIIEKGLHNHLLSLQVLKVALPKLVPEEREKVVEYFQTLENLDYLRHKDGVSVIYSIYCRSFVPFLMSLIKRQEKSF